MKATIDNCFDFPYMAKLLQVMRFLEMNFNNLKDDNMKVFLFYVHILQQILLVVKVTIVITFVINFSDAITFPSVSFVVFKNLLL